VAKIKESTYDLLKERLDSGQSPAVSSSDYAYTALYSEFIEKEDEEPVRRPYTPYDYTMDYFWMQYEDIQVSNNINVTNGSYFFTDDTVTTHLAYNHGRYGNFSDATEPENLNIYYLVPDGLEPVEDQEMFSSIQVFRGYRDGYNLVSVKPKNISKPVLEEGTSSITRTVQNSFTLSFKATNRLQIGRYEIYACASLDNNGLRVEENDAYTAEITGDAKQGFLITNTVTEPKNDNPNKLEKTETPVTPQPPKQTQTNTLNAAATGDSSNIMLFVVVLIIAGIAAGTASTYVVMKRKKENND
jgi:hypothetical protein